MKEPTQGNKKPEKATVSFSEISMFAQCQYQWYYRYVLGKKRPPAVAMAVGTGVHKAADANLTSKLQTGKLLDVEEAVSFGVQSFTETLEAEDVELDEEEQLIGKDKVIGQAVDKVVRLTRCHSTEIAPLIDPVAVEEFFRVELPDQTRDLTGRLDVLERIKVSPSKKRPSGEALGVRDLKTTKKTPGQDDAVRDLQLSVYALGTTVNRKEAPVRLAKDYIVDLKAGPKREVREATRDEADLRNIAARIRVTIAAMNAGALIPTDPDNWWCSEKWCGYYSECPFGAKKQHTVPIDGFKH